LANLDEKLDATKRKEISITDFVSFLESEAETGELSRPFIEKSFAELPDLGTSLAETLDGKVETFLASHSAHDGSAFRNLVDALLQREPSGALKSKHLFEVAEKADQLLAAGKDGELSSLLDTSTGAAEKAVVSSRLAKVGSGVEKEINAISDPFEAIKKLALSQKLIPGTTVGAAAERILVAMDKAGKSGTLDFEKWPLTNADVLTLLRFVVQTRPSLKLLIADLCEDHIRDLIKNNKAKGLDETYSLLLETRPDPNKRNDELRLRIVLDAGNEEVRGFALGRLEELRYSGAINILDKLRIMLKGYYGRGAAVFFVSSVVIILVCAILMFIRPVFVAGVTEALMSAEKRTADAASRRSKRENSNVNVRDTATHRKTVKLTRPSLTREKYVPGYMRAPIEDDEYTRILKYFGLEDGATESQIKKAYRDKVKSLHPDAKPGEVHTEDQAFIELKEVYDRLLQIRSSMFGSK